MNPTPETRTQLLAILRRLVGCVGTYGNVAMGDKTLEEFAAEIDNLWISEIGNMATTALELTEERDEARAACASIQEALGMSTPWPITSVLITARDWLNHLSLHHNCDCHGYEASHECVTVISKMGPKINAALHAARDRLNHLSGKGWHSPEEWAKLEDICFDLRAGKEMAEAAYEEANKKLEEQFKGVICIRCVKHHQVPPYNTNEASGGECPVCHVEKLEACCAEMRQALIEIWESISTEDSTIEGYIVNVHKLTIGIQLARATDCGQPLLDKVARLEAELERAKSERNAEGMRVRNELLPKLARLEDTVRLQMEVGKGLEAERGQLRKALEAADHALASYAMGNASPDLAAQIHGYIESVMEYQSIEQIKASALSEGKS